MLKKLQKKTGKSAAVGGITTPTASLQPSTAATTLELMDYIDKVISEERGTTTTSSAHAATTSSTRAASGRKGVGSHKKKNPQPPAALSAHQGWILLDSTKFEEISFDYQDIFLDELLTIRVNNYLQYVCRRFSDKLKVHF